MAVSAPTNKIIPNMFPNKVPKLGTVKKETITVYTKTTDIQTNTIKIAERYLPKITDINDTGEVNNN